MSEVPFFITNDNKRTDFSGRIVKLIVILLAQVFISIISSEIFCGVHQLLDTRIQTQLCISRIQDESLLS